MAGATYNVTRFTRQVLKRHRKEPPSLVLHLYPTHFRFEQQVRALDASNNKTVACPKTDLVVDLV